MLRVSVPDFDALTNVYQLSGRDLSRVSGELMGGQDNEYDFHRAVFNMESLTSHLKHAGFSEVRKWEPEHASYHDFDDWANFSAVCGGKKIPISLNLDAVK